MGVQVTCRGGPPQNDNGASVRSTGTARRSTERMGGFAFWGGHILPGGAERRPQMFSVYSR